MHEPEFSEVEETEHEARPLRVLVVDDHQTFADLLSRALAEETDLTCVGHVNRAGEAAAAIDLLEPDVLLMDLHLPDGDGITTAAEAIRRRPELRTLVLTAHPSLAEVERGIEAGVCGFLAKDGSLDDVLVAVRTAERGSLVLPAATLAAFSVVPSEASELAERLSPRELEVLRLLAQGRDPRGIAKQLGVSIHTCRDYIKSVLAKLDAHSQLEAVVVATRSGLINVGP